VSQAGEREKLSLSQDEVRMNGPRHRVRIHAEPAKDFMPTPGVITAIGGARLAWACDFEPALPGLQRDAFYDSLSGKLMSFCFFLDKGPVDGRSGVSKRNLGELRSRVCRPGGAGILPSRRSASARG